MKPVRYEYAILQPALPRKYAQKVRAVKTSLLHAFFTLRFERCLRVKKKNRVRFYSLVSVFVRQGLRAHLRPDLHLHDNPRGSVQSFQCGPIPA